MDANMLCLLRGYSAMVPVRLIPWPQASFLAECEFQATFVFEVLLHEKVQKFPPARTYTKAFFKKYISLVEETGEEIHPTILDIYMQIVTEGDNQEEFCYKTYWLDSERGVTLKETVQMLSKGTTGLTTWKAALLLTEFLLGHPAMLHGRSLVELGSGVGLVGMAACLIGQLKQAVLTDYNEDVLLALRDNLKINRLGSTAKPSENGCHGNSTTSVRVDRLDWLYFEREQLIGYRSDLVLASDVIYDDSVLEGLSRVLHVLLSVQNDWSDLRPIGFLANEIRNPDTYHKFLRALDGVGVSYEPIEPLPQQIFTYDRASSSLVILKLWVGPPNEGSQ